MEKASIPLPVTLFKMLPCCVMPEEVCVIAIIFVPVPAMTMFTKLVLPPVAALDPKRATVGVVVELLLRVIVAPAPPETAKPSKANPLPVIVRFAPLAMVRACPADVLVSVAVKVLTEPLLQT